MKSKILQIRVSTISGMLVIAVDRHYGTHSHTNVLTFSELGKNYERGVFWMNYMIQSKELRLIYVKPFPPSGCVTMFFFPDSA